MERFSIDDAIKQSKIVANRYKWSAENADMGSEDANELNADICNRYVKEYRQIAKWLEEFKSYKQAEEQGLLVKLPCKVGDTVYVPTRNFVSELRITMVSVDMHGAYFSWMLNSGIYPNLDGFSKSKLGKTVFLT